MVSITLVAFKCSDSKMWTHLIFDQLTISRWRSINPTSLAIMHHVEHMSFKVERCFYSSHSTIPLHQALHCFNREPFTRNTFVVDRESNIQTLCDRNYWLHFEPKSKQADVVSRDIITEKLISSDLWFTGPKFLFILLIRIGYISISPLRYSTACFLGSFKRFVITHSLSSKIFIQNEINFDDSNFELRELNDILNSSSLSEDIKWMCRDNNISWHSYPLVTPHFGEHHDATLKSTQYHIVMWLDETKYEYLMSILFKIS